MTLATTERTTLAACEDTIERGLATFVEVGEALRRIRDGRLYRESHGTFEDYCRERWDMARNRAYQLMEAATVVTSMSKNLDTPPPSKESHAAALAPLKDDPERMREAWTEAVEHNGHAPTAKEVREVVQRHVNPEPEEPAVTTDLNRRQEILSNAARNRLNGAVSTLDGLCRGLDDFDLSRFAGTATEGEIDQWSRSLTNAISTLRRFRAALQEGEPLR